MSERKLRTYYLYADVKGSIAVMVQGHNKREALEAAKEAQFYDRMDVTLELAKGYHMEEANHED